MNKKYLSDEIKEEVIASWQEGDKILISGQTGMGKSYFIKNNLYDYCVKHNKKILLLTNRNVLKNQNILELFDKEDVITIRNYQSLETSITSGWNLNYLFSQYDYVVYDEAHYLFCDSLFNKKTDLLLSPIEETPKDKIFIFITATPGPLLKHEDNFKKYIYKRDYSYIKNIYFYKDKKVFPNIIKSIPPDEKIIYFANNINNAIDTSEEFLDAKFICSKDNEYSRKSSKQVINDISNDDKFNCRLLCTTKVIDNGINLVDPFLKHIIIDMSDIVTFIQCLGRKRITNEDDYINLYVQMHHSGDIQASINSINIKLGYITELKELGIEKFQQKYRASDFDDIIHNDFTINYAKHSYLIYSKQIYTHMRLVGYKEYLQEVFQWDVNKVKQAEEEFILPSIEEILDTYTNKKLFKEDQETFKAIMLEGVLSVLIPQKKKLKKLGINTINSILEEYNLNYHIFSTKDNTKEHRNERYWTIVKQEINLENEQN